MKDLPKDTAERKKIENTLGQIRDKNKELIALKESIKAHTVPEKKLRDIMYNLEEYFDKAHMPSLTLYSGDFAGEILELLFEHYPDMFSRDRYLRKSRERFRVMLGVAYEAVMANLKAGDVRPNQVVEFLKYIQPFLAKEEENADDKTAKLLFSVKVGEDKN